MDVFGNFQPWLGLAMAMVSLKDAKSQVPDYY